jgi:hypothetical protein
MMSALPGPALPHPAALRLLALALLLLTLLAGGCATRQPVATQVQAFSTLTALPTEAAQRRYRFERLPSQQNETSSHEQLELQTRAALQTVGLQLAGALGDDTADPERAPHYSVQVQLRQNRQPYHPYAYDPFWGWGWGWGPRMHGAWASPYWASAYELTRSELSLLLREIDSGQIVYEAHALHHDLALAPELLVPALLQAALRDFPHPPSGSRQLLIEPPSGATP